MNSQINRFLLWWFLLPSGFYRRIGADMAHVKAILETKLLIDDRSPKGLQKIRNQREGKETNTATMITMILSLVMGLLITSVFLIEDDITRLTLYLAAFGFLLAMLLITDFSHILIDAKDNYIILPKPVSPMTFLLGRLLHILIHLSKIILPLALPAWIAMWITRGFWGAVVFIPIFILLTMLTFALVNMVYLLIIRIFTPSRINSIITTIQIAFSVILYGSFQLVNQMAGKSVLDQIDINQFAWAWLFPSYWLANGWLLLYTLRAENDLLLGAGLSLMVPIVGVWVMIKYLAPAFFRKISMVSAGSGSEEKKEDTLVKSRKASTLSGKIAIWFTRKGIEREAFLFAWRLTGRSRDFKLKVYPQIGYLVILLVVFLLRKGGNEMIEITAMDSPQMKMMIVSLIYLSTILYMSAIAQVYYHEQFKAAWMYWAAPLVKPGYVIRGAIKAFMAKFFWSVLLILCAAGILIFGPAIIPNLVCGFGNVFLIATLFSWLWVDSLPFSLPPKKAGENQSTYRNLLMFILLPLFGVPHYFLFEFPIVLCMVGLITSFAGWVVLSYTRGIGWESIK